MATTVEHVHSPAAARATFQPVTAGSSRPTQPPFWRVTAWDVPLLAALLAVVVWGPLSVAEAGWVEHLASLPWLAAAAAAFGFLLARTGVGAVIAHLLALTAGIQVVAFTFIPVAEPGTVHERFLWLVDRIAEWLNTVFEGGVSNDPLLFAVAMAALTWMLGYSSGWLLFRAHAPWLVVVTNSIALLMNLSYAPVSFVHFLAKFLVSALLLLAVHQFAQRHELWGYMRMRVEGSVARNALIGSALITGLFVSLAWALPPAGTNRQVMATWDRVTTPWRGMERDFDRIFASLNSVENPTRGLTFGSTLAPRGAFELGETPVLLVETNEPRYYRATTADRYTGNAITSSDITPVYAEAQTNLLADDQRPDARREVALTVTILAARSAVAFVPEAPLWVSTPTWVERRTGPQDISTVRLETPLIQGEQYEVMSLASSASVQQLRSAGEDYPQWVRERYLSVENLSERVKERAREITRGIPQTPYDKAVAIESHLRESYGYSTRLDTVPEGQDWVEYFLFEMDEGYCDYFATSMMMLLRSVGVPARVASGFAAGERDEAAGGWLIRENQAHSWVEAYFPRYGWITFEPSSIRARPDRLDVPGAPGPTPVAEPPLGETAELPLEPDELEELQGMETGQGGRSGPTLPGWLATVLVMLGAFAGVALLGVGLFAFLWTRGLGRLAHYQRPYAQLVRLTGWLGVVRPARNQTPYEYADGLAREVPPARAMVRDLAEAYVEGTYGSRAPRIDPWMQWRLMRRQFARTLAEHRLRRFFRRK